MVLIGIDQDIAEHFLHALAHRPAVTQATPAGDPVRSQMRGNCEFLPARQRDFVASVTASIVEAHGRRGLGTANLEVV